MNKGYSASTIISVCDNDRPVLASLRNKEGLCVADITYDILVKLWADELASDSEIAEVFNTDAYLIREIRHQFGIDNKACLKKYMEEAQEILGSIGSSIMLVGNV